MYRERDIDIHIDMYVYIYIYICIHTYMHIYPGSHARLRAVRRRSLPVSVNKITSPMIRRAQVRAFDDRA